MDKMRVGVIGCGAISGNHFHALEKTENAALAAVSDIDPVKLEKAVREQNAEGYADWRGLIARADIDAVHVCVPHCLHAEITVAALRAGKHVLCEKPLGISLREAEEMVRAARESGKTLTVCFQNRFNGVSMRMKRLIDGGSMGKVVGGTAFVCWNRFGAYYHDSPWRGKWATEGGSALINQAIHTLDLMKWLSGGFEVRACTMSAKRLPEEIETEDTCDILLENASGGRFLFYCSNCAPANMPVQLHLVLEKGELHMDGSCLTVRRPEGVTHEDYGTEVKVGKDYWGSGHDALIDDFYTSLSKGGRPLISPEDGMETTRLVEAAYRASAEIRRRPG